MKVVTKRTMSPGLHYTNFDAGTVVRSERSPSLLMLVCQESVRGPSTEQWGQQQKFMVSLGDGRRFIHAADGSNLEGWVAVLGMYVEEGAS